MENLEQVEQTTIQETTTENSTTTVENKEVEPEWVAPTKEEYDKQLKSVASKAKYEILKELGIESVKSFKDKENIYDNAIKESENIKTENQKLKEEIYMRDLEVAEDYREDFLTLVKAKVSDSKDFKSAGLEVLEKNPNWKIKTESVKLGNEKSEQKETAPYSELSKKYPWL